MPLFSDGSISEIDDLRAYDAGVLEVASAEQIDLGAKLGVATTELGIELEEFLCKRTGRQSGSINQAQASLSHIVVTPALKHWHTLRALSLIYGDARGGHLNSLYEGKWKECKLRDKWAAETLLRTGIGLVHIPVARAEAPEIRTIQGVTPPATYLVKIAWKNMAGESGAPSETAVVILSEAGILGVSAVNPPSNAVGFDVYVGYSGAKITKQNQTTVEPEQEWIMPETGLVAGVEITAGQEPGWWLREDRILQRG